MTAKTKPLLKYLPSYLDYLEIEKGLSVNSQKNYARFLNHFFKWLAREKLDRLSPAGFTKEHIGRYRLFLARHLDPKTGSTLKKNTQNLYLIALRSLLEFFSEKGVPAVSPTAIKLAKDKSDKEIKFLTLDQIERLLLAPDTGARIGLRDRAILEVLFSTGLRVAEMAGLDRDQLRINNSTSDLEIAVVGKGRKIRTVYFSERAVFWLKKYLDSRRDVIDPALFVNYKRGASRREDSRRLTTKSIEEIVKKYVKTAGLPVMATPHTIRHSFATDLLTQGVDLRLVQEFLGHRNIATTQIYTHVTSKRLQDVNRRLHGGRRLKN